MSLFLLEVADVLQNGVHFGCFPILPSFPNTFCTILKLPYNLVRDFDFYFVKHLRVYCLYRLVDERFVNTPIHQWTCIENILYLLFGQWHFFLQAFLQNIVTRHLSIRLVIEASGVLLIGDLLILF